MSPRFHVRAGMLAIAAVICLASGVLGGQSATNPRKYAPPKTGWGDPDLQGKWTNTTTTPFERPSELAGKEVLSDEELVDLDKKTAARVSFDNAPRPGNPGGYNEFWVERGRLSKQTSLVIDPVDGRLPPLTPEAQKRAAERADYRRDHPADGPEDTGLFTRCLTRGMPSGMVPGFYNHNYQIFQSPGYVAITLEMIHEFRIIPLDGRPHVGAGIRHWLGDSRGRWDGNTLVVETTNFTPKIEFRNMTGGLRLTERFTRTADDTIDYRFTVDDPSTYTRPWTAAIPMSALDGNIYEYACHEGNYGIFNILSGHRAEEHGAAKPSNR